MKYRCLTPTDKHYSSYGGRGITVSDDWLIFENFYRDMGEKPAGMSLDRIDNNKGYSKENCRWATQREQMRNTRCNRMITHNGETLCITEWAEKYGIPMRILSKRLKAGKSFIDAVKY